MVSSEINIDLCSYTDRVLSVLQQGEAGGREIKLNVRENGIAYKPLQSNVDIYKLQIDKPDGTSIIITTDDKTVAVEKSILEVKSENPLALMFHVGKNVCAVQGILHCKLSIVSRGSAQTLRTVMFKLRVDAGVKREEDVISTSEYKRIEDFIDTAGKMDDKITSHINNKNNPHEVTASAINVYTKNEVNTKLDNIYTKSEIDTKFSSLPSSPSQSVYDWVKTVLFKGQALCDGNTKTIIKMGMSNINTLGEFDLIVIITSLGQFTFGSYLISENIIVGSYSNTGGNTDCVYFYTFGLYYDCVDNNTMEFQYSYMYNISNYGNGLEVEKYGNKLYIYEISGYRVTIKG